MTNADNPPSSTTQSVFRVLLGVFLLGAGIGHLTFARTAFQAQVPDFVPMSKDTVVLLSGVVEVLAALSVIFLVRYRVWIGAFLALLFVLVFPGNIAQWVHHRSAFGLDTDAKRLARLFFQPPLVIWALWSTGAWSAYRQGRSLSARAD
ncbi:MAG TPA: hypothetical protein VGM82_13380 [Gemmatimonadaceae bacterium]|jgi:uncharacterized membrane protein